MTGLSRGTGEEPPGIQPHALDSTSGDFPGLVDRTFMEFASARQVITQEKNPEAWARITKELGSLAMLRINGEKLANLTLAIDYYLQALTVYRRDLHPSEWADCQYGLGEAYRHLSDGRDRAALERSLRHYEMSLTVVTREAWPERWHNAHLGMSLLYMHYGMVSGDSVCMKLSDDHYQLARCLDRQRYPEMHDAIVSCHDTYSRLMQLKSAVSQGRKKGEGNR